MINRSVALGELAEFFGGGTPSKSTPKFYEGDIPWVSPKDMKSWIISDSDDHITAEAVKSSATRIVPPYSILIVNRSGILKRKLPVGITSREVAINQDLKALVCKSTAHPPYVARMIAAAEPIVLGWVRATTADNFPVENLKNLQIPLPPLEEQKRIAAILDQADELRRKRQRALDRLNQLGQAIFIEMFGDPAINPKNWPKISLAECCSELDDIRCGPFGTQLLREEFQQTGVPLWGIKQVNRGFSILTDEFVTPRKAQELSNYDVVEDDIVMTRKGTVGNCALYPKGFPPGVMHSDLLRVRLDRMKAVPQFVAYQLHISRDVERQIELISGGAIMQGINVGKLKQIKVLLPPLALQARYSVRMTEVGLQVSAMKRWLDTGEALFASLQHRAFHGEL